MFKLVSLIQSKPHLGVITSFSGGVAGLLTFLKIITPIFGFISVLIGCIAGLLTVMVKWREWQRGKRHKTNKQ